VICRETGDRHGEGGALINLGPALCEMRRFEEAITACQDAAVIFREIGDPRREDDALENLARIQAARDVRDRHWGARLARLVRAVSPRSDL